MADRYTQVRKALAQVAAENLRRHADRIEVDPGCYLGGESYEERTALAAQRAMQDVGLVEGLAKKLFADDQED